MKVDPKALQAFLATISDEQIEELASGVVRLPENLHTQAEVNAYLSMAYPLSKLLRQAVVRASEN